MEPMAANRDGAHARPTIKRSMKGIALAIFAGSVHYCTVER